MQLSRCFRRDVAHDAELLLIIKPCLELILWLIRKLACPVRRGLSTLGSEVALRWVGQSKLGHGRNSNDEWFGPFREGFPN